MSSPRNRVQTLAAPTRVAVLEQKSVVVTENEAKNLAELIKRLAEASLDSPEIETGIHQYFATHPDDSPSGILEPTLRLINDSETKSEYRAQARREFIFCAAEKFPKEISPMLEDLDDLGCAYFLEFESVDEFVLKYYSQRREALPKYIKDLCDVILLARTNGTKDVLAENNLIVAFINTELQKAALHLSKSVTLEGAHKSESSSPREESATVSKKQKTGKNSSATRRIQSGLELQPKRKVVKTDHLALSKEDAHDKQEQPLLKEQKASAATVGTPVPDLHLMFELSVANFLLFSAASASPNASQSCVLEMPEEKSQLVC